MKLPRMAINWAINHLFRESDTDLFPRPLELDIIETGQTNLVNALSGIEVGDYVWHAGRRFPVPKDNTSIRMATQLHLIDSIFLGAIIYCYGAQIESRRATDRYVYSYRFRPEDHGVMYANKYAWKQFWTACKAELIDEEGYEYDEYSCVLTCDVSDFYNQVSLEIIREELTTCSIPAQVVAALDSMLEAQAGDGTRGIPVGPHASHLLADLALRKVDATLIQRGINFKRYVDDYVIFCASEKQARNRITELTELLDQQGRMVLQRSKIKITGSGDFVKHCREMLMEDKNQKAENEILSIINDYSDGNAYARINIEDIDDRDLKKLSAVNITDLLESYLKAKSFERIRWFYRRLAQIGLPHAVDFSIEHFEELIPALNDVCLYINSCAEHYEESWRDIGEEILDILEDESIRNNEFFKISLLNLFAYNPALNHIKKLIALFDGASPGVRRKILLAARFSKEMDWLLGLYRTVGDFDIWTKQAYLIACTALPKAERTNIYDKLKLQLNQMDILQLLIINWGNNQP